MKKLICALAILTSIASYANETHSPQFECHTTAEPDKKMFLLIGNEFPQSPNLDWSHQAYFAPKESYYNLQYQKTPVYLIGDSDAETLTAVNPEDTTQYLVLSGETSLFVYNSEGVTSYSCVPLRFGRI